MVTGGSRGIGAAVASRIAQLGHHVLINYAESREAAEQLTRRIHSADGSVSLCKADIGSEEGVTRIERGTLWPGQRIMPQELAQKIGISATPVREALCQLVGRDILVERPREGFYVAPITSGTLRALYAAHGRVIEMLLPHWRMGARFGDRASTYWKLFNAVAASADDDALAGMQHYLAGRLAIARKHEAAHLARGAVASDFAGALRADNHDAALQISRNFHCTCASAAPSIWQQISDR